MVSERVAEHRAVTRQLKSARESALRGRYYDGYVRWIISEGLESESGGWWPYWPDWVACQHSAAANFTDPMNMPVCPLQWSTDDHAAACKYAFAPPVPPSDAAGPQSARQAVFTRRHNASYAAEDMPELNVPAYMDPIREHRVVERQLARGGVRLAAVLNAVLRDVP